MQIRSFLIAICPVLIDYEANVNYNCKWESPWL